MKWNRWAVVVIMGLFVLYFALVTVPASPISVIVLPVLLGLSYWGLRQNRLIESEGSLFERFAGHASMWNYLGLFCLPVTGISIYALAIFINLKVHTNWVLYLVTTPIGFLVFLFSLFQLQRRARLALSQRANKA